MLCYTLIPLAPSSLHIFLVAVLTTELLWRLSSLPGGVKGNMVWT